MLFNFIPNSYKFIFLISLATLVTSSFALTKRDCPSSWRGANIRCPTQPNLVCAYFSGGNCDSDLCAKQVLTPCSACQDPLVKYFTDGYCELDKVYCDDNSRSFFPPYCYLDGNVCGFYKQGCPVEICALEMDSSCAACRDPKILYYKLGTCDVQDKVNECQPDQCSKSESPAKYQIYNPVCAFRANCVGRNCAKTFNNECTACTTRGYTQFKNGICDQDKTDCATTNRALNCRNEKKSPVCAYFTVLESPIGTLVGRAPADNSCSACLDTTVKYFTRGSCSSLDQRTYCPVYQRPTSCSRSNDVVCGYTPDDSNFVPYQEFRNSCEACKDSNVVYHEPGPCPILCTGNEGADGFDNACSGSKVDPVCVPYYDSTGKRRFMSVKNNCVACVDLNIGSNSYFKGLCSGADRALQCANEVPSYYYGSIYPVCGYLKENCQSSSCRMTFAEPIMACNYPAVSYLPGVCPGDQGISCDIYRNRKGICDDKKTLTNRVCGYTKKNCTGSSCRKTYQNQCYACDNRSVLYFVKGSC